MIRIVVSFLMLLGLTFNACNSQKSIDNKTSSGPAPVWGSTTADPVVATSTASPQPAPMLPEIVNAAKPAPHVPFPAMTPPPQAKLPSADYPPRINVEQLQSMMQSKTAVVIDVRTLDAYQQSHIPGALHIPFDQITARSGELKKGKAIITYCT